MGRLRAYSEPIADMTDLIATIEGIGADAFVEAQQAMVDLLIERAPQGETGVLRESFQAFVGSTGVVISGEIVNTAAYASFVSEGTSPHEITGNPLLAFEWGGATVIVHSVQHPGTQANPFWTETVTDEQWATLLQGALDGLSR